MCFEVDFISYKRTKCVSQIERGFGKKLTSSQDMAFGSSCIVFDTFGKCNNGPLNPSTHMPFKIYGLEGDITFPG